MAAIEACGQIGREKRSKNIWWTEEIEDQMKWKKVAYLTGTEEDRQHYVRKRKMVNKLVLRNKRETFNKKCMEVETYLEGSRYMESWKFIDNIRKYNKTSSLELINGAKLETCY